MCKDSALHKRIAGQQRSKKMNTKKWKNLSIMAYTGV